MFLVEKVKVTVLEPEQSTIHLYAYDESQKAIDAKTYCDALQFTCRYRPYDPGILFTDERGVYLKLTDGQLPACKVTLTFKKDNQSVAWYWDINEWLLNEEKMFESPKGGLTFDPQQVEMTISFTNTNYKHTLVFNLNDK